MTEKGTSSSKFCLNFMNKLYPYIFPRNEDNHFSHFHADYLSKTYFPIYLAFFIFSVIYSIEYAYNGFKWKRIIFAVTLAITLSKKKKT